MAYTATLTNTVVTTYTYDLANRLATAQASDSATVWHYVYDNNGNRLQQIPGGLTPTEGAIQYAYNQSNQLIQVETHDGRSFQLQAEMVYDGMGNRLQAIAHSDGTTITATYTLDPRGGRPLLVDNGINVTMILYGQTAIGEYAAQTAEWAYYLGDVQLSVRQLVDAAGVVTQAQTYGPYGVLLHQAGDGGGLFGYQGGQAAANGLWYFGDGYFDPDTGQFLSRKGNPLLPLAAAAMANPGSFLLGPVLFINWRRRKGKKGVHPATLLLFGVLLAAGISGCAPTPTPIPEVPTPPPTGTPAPEPTVTVTEVSTPTSTTIIVTITATPTACPTPTQPPPTDTPTPGLDYWAELARIEGSEVLDAGGSIKNVLDLEDDALTLTRVAMGEGSQDPSEGHADRVDIMWTIRIRVLMSWSNIGSNTPTNIKTETLNSGQYAPVVDLYRVDNEQREKNGFFNPAALCSSGRNNLNLMVYPCSDQDVEWFRNAYMEAVTIVNAPLTQVPNYLRGYESNRGNQGPTIFCRSDEPGAPAMPTTRFGRTKGNRYLDCHPKDNRMYPEAPTLP